MADELARAVRSGKSVQEASAAVWQALWPQEKRTQVCTSDSRLACSAT